MISRRGFVQACAAVAAFLIGRPAIPPEIRYGPIDVERHRFLNRRGFDLLVIDRATGADLTSRCYFADDTGEGYALVFKHNAAGKPYLDPTTGDAARDRVDGIRIRRHV